MLRMLSMAGFAITAMGCGSTHLALSGEPGAPKPPKCEFTVFTSQVPPGEFAEIGVIDVKPGGYGSNVHTDISDFKEEVAPHVCKAGGDAVLAFANGYGMWIKGTVLRRVAAPSAPARAVAGQPPAQQGCQFDTQCKGDRVCNAGQCMAPVAPAEPPVPAATSGAAAPAPATPQQ